MFSTQLFQVQVGIETIDNHAGNDPPAATIF
jgi:hypothetical protein